MFPISSIEQNIYGFANIYTVWNYRLHREQLRCGNYSTVGVFLWISYGVRLSGHYNRFVSAFCSKSIFPISFVDRYLQIKCNFKVSECIKGCKNLIISSLCFIISLNISDSRKCALRWHFNTKLNSEFYQSLRIPFPPIILVSKMFKLSRESTSDCLSVEFGWKVPGNRP